MTSASEKWAEEVVAHVWLVALAGLSGEVGNRWNPPVCPVPERLLAEERIQPLASSDVHSEPMSP